MDSEKLPQCRASTTGTFTPLIFLQQFLQFAVFCRHLRQVQLAKFKKKKKKEWGAGQKKLIFSFSSPLS